MKIVICGAGLVGAGIAAHLAEVLVEELSCTIDKVWLTETYQS